MTSTTSPTCAHGLEGLGLDALADHVLQVHDHVDGVDAVKVEVLDEAAFAGDAFGVNLEEIAHHADDFVKQGLDDEGLDFVFQIVHQFFIR